MPEMSENDCIGTANAQIRSFLKEFGCRRVECSYMEAIIRGIAKARGEDWLWIEKWFKEQGPRWVNDMDTLFFEHSLENLTGAQSLHFAQVVWMLEPSDFEYQIWGGHAFVRMWWDRDRPRPQKCNDRDEKPVV